MSSQESGPSCSVWDPASCVGTPKCPPRCPRFIDKYGEPILIRPFSDGDRGALISFYDGYPDTHRSMLLPPRGQTAVKAWLDRLLERGRHILAFHHGRLVGHTLYSPREATQSELLVFVDEEFHSRGIGTELCRQAIAYAAADGHEAMELRVERGNTTALGVYGRLGFRVVEEHGDNIEMRLDIDDQRTRQVQAPPAERD